MELDKNHTRKQQGSTQERMQYIQSGIRNNVGKKQPEINQESAHERLQGTIQEGRQEYWQGSSQERMHESIQKMRQLISLESRKEREENYG